MDCIVYYGAHSYICGSIEEALEEASKHVNVSSRDTRRCTKELDKTGQTIIKNDSDVVYIEQYYG